ncbi:type I restriction endonuclease subunit R [Klebsiella pneumoniae]|uniref:type I restriction endonuclease subunit R n=1 Tax=Klebsiella pneumoniae TaxID=573 RepID=UPI000B3E88FF|nr:type I restriction endonuclease subunit R [Klebsiella pneumoniae]MBS2837231.1 type I restriction endonuclease subunit R [Klebsiella pneumoniae]MCX9984813.1 type I restriction endonuclease subunit R [Klebsiella pneumoniae]MCY0000457.1 type I restriction endonuclease subunit R [Klebsiella pneumoniae]MDE4811232.1 type I restriction endonuclease subunit R [Klebsiella pneumoniae]OUY62296.1 DEAD/DEAH box helicase [Klebsiella pneumoniae]
MTKEQQIEQALITKLQDLKYTYRDDIRDKTSLEQNFRKKFEALNRINLSDAEFNRLRDEIITADVFLAAQSLREKGKFTREDGTPLEYMLVNLKDWCKNDFEVISQLRINTDNSHHRYDVILLLNGLPMVQIELKSLQISPRRAMEQIVEYKNDTGNGYTNTLLCFIQLFIISNGNDTRYFANNRKEHFSFNADERFLPIYQHADKNNKKIAHLHEFADDFLSKCTLGQLISRYMVLMQSEQKMLIMRPYQIYAVKAIVDAIHQNRGNGYIWHTTGSGKTLTSFKASTLLKDYPDIEKCLFVVDRKDLDRQTREEFNKFQEGCVEQNTNTETLVRRMLSEDYADKVIVTTIQKLGLALDENSKRNKAQQKNGRQTYKERLEPLRDKRVVFIFDECHRSQFGENHKAIKEFFPKAQLFGFTGTPIFDENSSYQQVDGNMASFKTTKDIFEKELHSYTITHAIEDKNVLSFHIDYYGKNDGKGGLTKPKKKELPPPEAVIKAILDKHDSATNHRRFNAVLSTASINHAIEYFELFKSLQAQKQAEDENFEPLNIACVFSPPAQVVKENDGTGSINGSKNTADIKQLQEDLPQESADNQVEPEKKKVALMAIIADYNVQYGTNHTINEFDLYYQDVQQRIKDQKYSNSDYPRKNKIDIIIVVDMLLTGFDSKYLNTLYVDKNLKYHGLIQAFSRTNRVLNDTKPWGNILDFRYQENEVNTAIALFSSGERDKAREIWLVDPAHVVIKRFEEKVEALQAFMKSKGLTCEPSDVHNLKGDTAKAEFINHFKEVQKLKTQLEQYTDLEEESKVIIEQKLPTDTLRGFKAIYLDIAAELRRKQCTGDYNEEAVEQLEFDLVLFASSIIDYDYIMGLIAKSTQKAGKHKMTRQQLIDLISSHSNLESEREDIIAYIKNIKVDEVLNEFDIREGYQAFKAQKATQVLAQIAKRHQLETQSLQAFVSGILDRMIFDGEQLTDLLAPLELGWKARRVAELALMEDLVPYLKKQAEDREISGLDAYE